MDRDAAERLSLPTSVLMENAGRAVASAVLELVGSRRIVVVCGKGNNGGDGYVAARHLVLSGCTVSTLSLAPIHELKGEARRNAEAALTCVPTFAGRLWDPLESTCRHASLSIL